MLAWAVEGRSWRGRAVVGVVTGLGFLVPGLFWMSEFSAPGYLLSAIVESLLFAFGIVLVPQRWALPGGLVVAEALRRVLPFGGVPIALVSQTQVGGPLAGIARLGGELLLAAAVGLAGVALASLATRRSGAFLAAAAVVVVVARVGAIRHTEVVDRFDVALVQGGGERGTQRSPEASAATFARHVEATASIDPDADLVVWPEDTVDIDGRLADSGEGEVLEDLVAELGVPLVIGLVEGGDDSFRNATVALSPDGDVIARYDKNQRVPFGEYIPLRSVVDLVADVSAVPRDAVAGTEPGLLELPPADVGVLISYEVFFARRAGDALAAGAEVLLVPTNASSFSTTQTPSLELAAARLRAIETGRELLQVAPTGYTAAIDADGRVRERSELGERLVLDVSVGRRRGRTPYTRLGDGPFTVAAVLALAVAWVGVLAGGRVRRRGGGAVAPPREVDAGGVAGADRGGG